jgi:hypothetical protein
MERRTVIPWARAIRHWERMRPSGRTNLRQEEKHRLHSHKKKGEKDSCMGIHKSEVQDHDLEKILLNAFSRTRPRMST